MEETDCGDPKYLMSGRDVDWVAFWRMVQWAGVVAAITAVLWAGSVLFAPAVERTGLERSWVAYGYPVAMIAASCVAGACVGRVLGVPLARKLENTRVASPEGEMQDSEQPLTP